MKCQLACWPSALGISLIAAGMMAALVPITRGHSAELRSARSSQEIVGSFRTAVGRATHMSVSVSPDGTRLLVDALGGIYELPVTGGNATRIGQPGSWDEMPAYSPDGKLIAFISDRAGDSGTLWVMSSDGKNARQITKDRVTAPSWMPDGRHLLARDLVTEGVNQYGLDAVTVMRDVAGMRGAGDPSANRDGSQLLFDQGDRNKRNVFIVDRQTSKSEQLTSCEKMCFQGKLTPDGKLLLYFDRDEYHTILKSKTVKTGQIKSLKSWQDGLGTYQNASQVGYVSSQGNFSLAPDGKSLFVSAGGELLRINIVTAAVESVPFNIDINQEMRPRARPSPNVLDAQISIRQMRWPTMDQSRRFIAFNSVNRIWLVDTATGSMSAIVVGNEARVFAPSISPDGNFVAYAEWNDRRGSIKILDLRSKMERKIVEGSELLVKPTWISQGRNIIYYRIDASALDNPTGGLVLPAHIDAYDLALGKLREIAKTSLYAGSLRQVFLPITYSNSASVIFFMGLNPENTMEKWVYQLGPSSNQPEPLFGFIAKQLDAAVISPSGTKVAITGEKDLWWIDLSRIPRSQLIDAQWLGQNANRIARRGVSYVQWLNDSDLFWSNANEFTVTRIESGSIKSLSKHEIELEMPRYRASGTVAYTNASVISEDMRSFRKNTTLLVENGKIVAVAPDGKLRLSRHTTIVDLGGKFVIPGLIDVHAHLHSNSSEAAVDHRALEHSLRAGVTTLFDPSASTTTAVAKSEELEVGSIVGPRLFTTGFIILGDELGGERDLVKIDNSEDAYDFMSALKKNGAIMAKVYGQNRRSSRALLADAARAVGIGITIHLEGDNRLPLTATVDGYTALEHDSLYTPIQQDWLELLARSGVNITGTMLMADNTPWEESQKHHNSLCEKTVAQAGRSSVAIAGAGNSRRLPNYIRSQIADLARIQRAGGKVSLGSHGQGGIKLHRELWLAVLGGFSPSEALKSATINGAEKIGLENQMGSISAGKVADFVVLNSDPLKNICNTFDIYITVKGGVRYDPIASLN